MEDDEPEIKTEEAPQTTEVVVPAATPQPVVAAAAAPEKEEPTILGELYATFFAKSWEMWIGAST
jgi:hypothetical protein